MKAEYKDDMFIVINRKHVDEAEKSYRETEISQIHSRKVEVPHRFIKKLFDAIDMFSEFYETQTGKKLDQKYYVCNQDEEYSPEVLRAILKGESEKMKSDEQKSKEIQQRIDDDFFDSEYA